MIQIPKTVTREFKVERNEDAPKNREVTFVLATDSPIERTLPNGDKYLEILDHSTGAMILRKNVPVLLNHNPDSGVVGKIVSFEVQDGLTIARAKISRSRLGNDVVSDLEDGLIENVSVGAQIKDYTVQEGEVPVVRIKSWEVVEASLLTFNEPADPATAVIALRTKQNEETPQQKGKEIMDKDKGLNVQENGAEVERSRVSEILALGTKYADVDSASESITSGASVEDYRKGLLERVSNRKPAAPKSNAPADGIDARDLKGYSIARAVRVLSGDQIGNTLEREVADEIQRKAGRSSVGIWVPFDSLYTERATSDTSTQLGTISTNSRPDLFERALRNKSVLAEAGAKILSGLTGNVSFGVASGASSYWTDEGATPTEGAYTSASRSLSPKHLKARVPYSRTLAIQSSPAIESLLREDLATSISTALDAAGIRGGDSGEPTGILEAADTNNVTFVSNLWATVVALESGVENNNIQVGSRAYLFNSKTVGHLKTTSKDVGSGQMIWEPGNTVNGYRAFSTNHLRSNLGSGDKSEAIFGNFEHLVMGFFGPGIELNLSEMDNAGNRTLRAFLDCDVVVVRPRAFSKIVNLDPVGAGGFYLS